MYEALQDAIEKHGQPKIFNTNQGSQFTSRTLSGKSLNVKSGSVWTVKAGLDNVFIERFWRSLKQEKIYLIILNTVKEAKNAITSYITFYNQNRIHQSLEYLTPKQVYFTKTVV